jgi:adenosylhomocysteine nucleosidase
MGEGDGMTDAIVVVAMDTEAESFRARADSVGRPVHIGHTERIPLTFGGVSVLLLCTGIGQVRAATGTAVALSEVGSVPVVSAGSAGGLGLDVRVGDVVVGDRYLFAGADATAFGYALGQIPGMPPAYSGSDAMIAAATSGAGDDVTVRVGIMLSGDAFVDARTVDGVRDAFPGALSIDMETTALAQTAYLADAPFLAVRGISDLCGPVAGGDFLTHVDDAADRSADRVVAMLRSTVGAAPAP